MSYPEPSGESLYGMFSYTPQHLSYYTTKDMQEKKHHMEISAIT